MNPTTASVIKTALKAYLDMGGQSPVAMENALKDTLPVRPDSGLTLTPTMLEAALEAYAAQGAVPDAVDLEAALKAALPLADKPAPRGAYGKRRLMLFYSYGGGVGRNDVTVPAGTVITAKLLTDWEQVLRQRHGHVQVVITGWQALEG